MSDTPEDLYRKACDALVGRVARFTPKMWFRDSEDVVTMRREDADQLLAIGARARQLARTRQRTIEPNR